MIDLLNEREILGRGNVADGKIELNRPLIKVDHVTHWFGQDPTQKVLNNVTIEAFTNELVCILGPSGCGKTTVLNMIAGFLRPEEGAILLNGKEIVEPGPDRGVVFQEYSLFPWLNILDNVAFGLRVKGLAKRERREIALSNLALVGLEKIADSYPPELSGGMRQRVAIARALAADPTVLLMDEPFAALDAMTRGGLQRQLLDIQKQVGQTIVFVTHNLAEAVYLADRIIVMSPNPGEVQFDEPVVLSRPRSRHDSGFAELYLRLERFFGDGVGE